MQFLKRHWDKFNCYLIFSIAFIPVVIFAHRLFTEAGMNFIRRTDGISQHFNMFIYLEKYLRSIVTGIFRGGIDVPLMNYTVGQGTDIILTLNGYDFFNPICILSVILFRKNLFFAYEFMIFTNLYLAGIAFCIFCRTIGRRNEWTVASGAMVYSFCGYALHFGTWAPIFISGMILLPLLLASSEIFYIKKKCLPLILTVFFSLMINYFTFYMNVIFLAVYLLIRFFPCPRDEIKDSCIAIIKTASLTIVGGLLAATMLLPAFFGALFNNGAYQVAVGYTESKLFYPATYYLKMIEYFPTTAGDAGYLNYLGFAPIAMVCLWVLFFTGSRKLNKVRVAVCIGFWALSIPFIGLALNGFRYANNRWAYAFGFIVAFALIETIEMLPKLSFRQNSAILICTAGLIFLWFNDPAFDKMAYIPHMLVVVTVAVILLCSRPFVPDKAAAVVFLILIVVSHVANITVQFNRDYRGEVYDFCDAGEGYGIYTKYSSSRVANSADDDEFYRIEMQEERVNTEGYNNVHGTTIYFSAVDGNCQQYYDDLQLTSRSHLTQMYGVSGSRALMDLASVRYFTLPSKEYESYVPFGFTEVRDCVYENDYYLAPAFLYKNYITYQDFMNLNPSDRQQAMLQGAVLKEDTDIVGAIKPSVRAKEVGYTVSCDNVSWENGWISSSEEGGSITLDFEPQPGCEVYVWLDNMKLDVGMTKRGITVTGGYRTEEGFEGAITKSVTASGPKYAYFVDRKGMNFNLVCADPGYNCATIEFEGPCNYSCDGIHILAVPMDGYVDDVNVLRNAVCDGIEIGKDRISGTVLCDEDSLLELSIPYSVGWKAWVDGKKVPILKSNIMYMALEMPAGSHEIKMKYCTPYLKAGLAISLITLAGIIAVAVLRRKRNM